MFERLNARMKNVTVLDVSLTKLSSTVFGIILAKLFPALLNINYLILIFLILLCGTKPFYNFWFKK